MITVSECVKKLAEFHEWLKEYQKQTDTVVTSEAVQDLMFFAWCAGQESLSEKLSKPHRGK